MNPRTAQRLLQAAEATLRMILTPELAVADQLTVAREFTAAIRQARAELDAAIEREAREEWDRQHQAGRYQECPY